MKIPEDELNKLVQRLHKSWEENRGILLPKESAETPISKPKKVSKKALLKKMLPPKFLKFLREK